MEVRLRYRFVRVPVLEGLAAQRWSVVPSRWLQHQ
jgi:hypothetical protein